MDSDTKARAETGSDENTWKLTDWLRRGKKEEETKQRKKKNSL